MAGKKPNGRNAVKDAHRKVERKAKDQGTGLSVVNRIREREITDRQQAAVSDQASQRLLLAIARTQSLFINEAKPETVFGVMLQELLNLTGSEYGFIGEVLWTAEQVPFLRTHAITDIAWNEETKALMAQQAPTLEFRNLQTLFGHVMTTGRPVISNDPQHDPRSGGLPPGHPPMHAFLGLPIYRGELLTGMVGMANRPGGYDELLVAQLEPFLSTCAQLLEGYRNRRLWTEAEAALRKSEERWQLAVRGSHDGIWDWDLRSNEVYFSPRWKEMLGYDDQEIDGNYQEWESRFHPEDRERVCSELTAYLEGRIPQYHVEFRLRRKNGEYCWIQGRGKAMWDAEGRPYRMAGSHTDITERKREEVLQAVEKRALESVAKGAELSEVLSFICQSIETHTAPMLTSIMLVTEDGTHLRCVAAPSLPDEYNHAVDGISIGPTVGSSGSAAYYGKPSIVVDIEKDLLWKNYVQLTRAHGLRACWSQPILSSTGTVLGIFAAYYKEPRTPNPAELTVVERAGHLAAVAIQHIKMSEALHESEARFQAFMTHSPAVTFIKDEVGRHVYVNPKFERLFSVSKEEVKNKTVFDFLPADIATRLHQNDQLVFSSGQTLELEETVPTPDGTAQHWLVIKFPLDTGEGRLLGGVAIDITARKQAQEDFRRTQFAMDQAVDAVYWIDPQARILYTNDAASAMLGYTPDEFLRMTVHDLNPNFPPEVWPGWWAETREKKVISLETVHLTKDGQRIPIDIRVSFLAYGGQEFHCAYVRDIRERKRVDEALRASQERFELAARATNDGIWDWNILTGEQYWSDRHLELFGLEPRAVTPTYAEWISLVHPDDADRVHQATCRHLEIREPYDIEMRVRMKDGRYRWFRDRGQALWDTTGRPVRMVGSISDVTEQRNAEEALRNAHAELEQRVDERTLQLAMANQSLQDEMLVRKRVEDRLQRTQYAVDHAADQIFIIDSNGFFVDVNESACSRLGYPKEELLRMSVMDIDPDFPSEAWGECWANLMRSGQFRMETRHRAKSGEIYPVEVVANYLCHAGQELDYAIVRDISERKRAEEAVGESELRYKLLTEATFDGVAIHDQGILIEVNAGLERIFGYESGELVGRFIWDLIADESRDLVLANMKNGVNGPYEAMGRRKDGTTFPGEIVVRPYCYRGKNVRLVAGRDITERKHLEAERSRHTEELEHQIAERTSEIAQLEAQRAQTEKLAAMGRLAAGVAHEINNPIAGIKNAFMLVKQAVDPAHPHAEFVGMIDREIARVASIVQQMYQLYRPESGKGEPVELRIMMKDIETLFAPRLQQRRLMLAIDVDSCLHWLCVPRRDVLQVLLNLLNNAVDCSSEGGTITLTVRVEPDAIRMAVSDQGPGISTEHLPHIFDPFFTTKTGGDLKGMGLGLSISQSLVTAMGGTIEVQTQPNGGSTFSVLLPRHIAQAGAQDQSDTIHKEVVHHDE